jgi:hypothetical protein
LQLWPCFSLTLYSSSIISAAKVTICGMQATIASAAALYALRNALPQGAARAGCGKTFDAC